MLRSLLPSQYFADDVYTLSCISARMLVWFRARTRTLYAVLDSMLCEQYEFADDRFDDDDDDD